ncbi:MAG TPA: penicillin-binding protein [Thermoanaerobaculia bacterium]|nr:penicillin-binding protein [Thermoanaerobaculia bacterium]
MGGVALWLCLLVARLVDLQLFRHAEFERRAKKQQERTVELPPRRGAITDAAGRPLAVTALVDSVFAIPSDIPDPAATAKALAPLVKLPVRDVEKKIGDPDKDFVWIARRVPESVAKRVAAERLPGVRLIKESTRRYPQRSLAASVLGYVGLDNQGLAGLEFRYDAEVRGRPVRVTLLRDAARRPYAAARAEGTRDDAPGVEGSSLVLTLDSAIQHEAENALVAAAETAHARGGSAVVLDPATGAILALASYPNFDPNRFGDASPDERRCRAVSDVYEPGSTFKVVAASAALEAGTIGLDDLIDCGGGVLTVGSTTIHEHGGNRWGALTLADILAHSSNIGIAHVGLGLGRGPFFKEVRAFGFGQKTGIEVDGETAGLLAEPSSWSALTLPTMSFGQEIGVTVLQMARSYAAIANGGLLVTPHLVAEIRRADGRVVKPAPPSAPRVMKEETAVTLRRLLARVVETGTGKLAAIPGYVAAGKTGTAQKANPGGGYARDKHVASFIGFVPAETPRVVIAVVLDEPKGKIYGGDVAAPVFATIGKEVLQILHEPPRSAPGRPVPPILLADLQGGARKAGEKVLTGDLVPASQRFGAAGGDREDDDVDHLPDLTGLSAREAVQKLARRGLRASLSGHGFVTSQEPAPGAALSPGSVCAVTLALPAGLSREDGR